MQLYENAILNQSPYPYFSSSRTLLIPTGRSAMQRGGMRGCYRLKWLLEFREI